MAMSGSAMGSAIHDAIVVAYGAAPDDAKLTEFCNALGTAIVSYIQSNAVVLPTALVAPSSGGPVTGTGTVE